jgi:hypothetical protein
MSAKNHCKAESSSSSNSSRNTSAVSVNHGQVLLCPALLPYLAFEQLARWSELSKEYSFVIQKYFTDIGYYEALCISFSGEQGLYFPQMKNARNYFFNEIWPSRLKWKSNDVQSNFKIRVSSRFSPGTRSNEKIELPLHQFLAVRRKQLKEKQEAAQNQRPDDESDDTKAVFVGENIPAEYLDPLMGTLMTDPVRLPGSQRVVDRSVAISCVLRGGRDPFDNSKLDFTMLVPLSELVQELKEFKERQEKHDDVGVKTDDALLLVKHLDPALLEALVAAEQLECASKRAVHDEWETNHGGPAQHNTADHHHHHHHHHPHGGHGQEEGDPAVDVPEGMSGVLDMPVERDERERDQENIENNSETSAGGAGGGASRGPRWRKDRGETSARILDTSHEKSCVTMHVPGSGVRPFHFNNVFVDKANQQTIYNDSARDLVTAALNGMNSCLLCYGQTGSGKTYTMFGPDDVCSNVGKVTGDRRGKTDLEVAESVISSKSSTGIVFRACAELLRAKVKFEKRGNVSMNLHVQFVEIYNDVVTDLMSGKKLSVQRANGELNGAVETKIESIDCVIDLLNEGHTRKHFASTAMNERSSRAHTAFIVQISQTFHDDSVASDRKLLKSQLYLVDLAGSERVKKSKAMGTQMTEAKSINSSLLVLGKVITRLSRSDIHVPYFESQLTTLLKGAFGGNSKTGVIVTCRSDDKTHGDETLQSLRFGEQCGMITNETRQAASCSIEALLATLDTSIDKVSAQLQSLKDRGKQNLPSFCSLENKLVELKTRRNDIEPVVPPTAADMSAAITSSVQ